MVVIVCRAAENSARVKVRPRQVWAKWSRSLPPSFPPFLVPRVRLSAQRWSVLICPWTRDTWHTLEAGERFHRRLHRHPSFRTEDPNISGFWKLLLEFASSTFRSMKFHRIWIDIHSRRYWFLGVKEVKEDNALQERDDILFLHFVELYIFSILVVIIYLFYIYVYLFICILKRLKLR